MPDFLALIDFNPLLSSCKKKKKDQPASNLHNSLVVEKFKGLCSCEEKTVPFLARRIILYQSQVANRSQHARPSSSLHREQCRFGCDPGVSGCDVTDRDHLIFVPQGDRGLPGARGPRGQQGAGIKGERVGRKCII